MSDSPAPKREKAPDLAEFETAQIGPTPAKADPTTEPTKERSDRGRRSNGRSRRRGQRRRPPRQAVERVMLVHADPDGSQIAVLEANNIVEHYVTREQDRSIVGNVYLGRVQNVLPGMEASFVDIGEGRNGVLYAGEVGIAGDEGDETPRIETVLKPGQPILVQVTKDPMRAKGARLTALVSIAGRHLVLVPKARSLGVSRRLSDAERERLRDLAQALRPSEHGLIVRTAAEGVSKEDLERDLKRLLDTWTEIDQRAGGAKAPALVYQEPELELRVIRDLFNRDVVSCVVDDAELESKLRTYVRSTSPDLDHRLELYQGALPIFEHYRVTEQIRKSLDRRVWLPSGGHIVIDRTEAMTVVDVNTGKFVGKSNLEATVFKTNTEAALEVARQLRVRDIGGIIVIDFIDMEDVGNRDGVIRTFRKELEQDRSRTQVFDISPLGLVQMTRKNVSTGIVEAFSDPCPTCEGRGILTHNID
ncbi:MAG: Rne/Rng family ribonuclease [Actinomycetota bacterium]|nr:Rne/Rng family ribonuclease [Actinomycetota bacterium]